MRDDAIASREAWCDFDFNPCSPDGKKRIIEINQFNMEDAQICEMRICFVGFAMI